MRNERPRFRAPVAVGREFLLKLIRFLIVFVFYDNADCMTVTSSEGQFFHKAAEDGATVCGVYFVTDPDRRVEIHFDYLDVPCQSGGLVSVSDESIAILHH